MNEASTYGVDEGAEGARKGGEGSLLYKGKGEGEGEGAYVGRWFERLACLRSIRRKMCIRVLAGVGAET